MNRVLTGAAAGAAALALLDSASAQQCYSPQNQCFSFAPPIDEVDRVDTGLNLRSNRLTISGDIRMRLRLADTTAGNPYNTSHQETTRARVMLDYEVNENANAVVEFNFSEVWAGAEGYSDAQPDPTLDGIASRQNFNGVAQAYLQLDDVFDLGEKIRVGRSNYFLANGMILGSCDFLQYPGAFTGVWASRSIECVDVELFMFDNYGPLQSQLPGGGERYYGGTGRVNISEDGLVKNLNAYYLAGSGSGDAVRFRDDEWYGVEGTGHLPGGLIWNAQGANRQVAGGKDVSAYRVSLEKRFEDCCGGFFQSVMFTRTDSEGSLQINPADFNTAGLLHQYAGIWRSDLDTNQVAVSMAPGAGIDARLTMLTLDHDGPETTGINQQLGDFEVDLLLGKELKPGVHVGAGYGFDNDTRQVGYFQVTVFF